MKKPTTQLRYKYKLLLKEVRYIETLVYMNYIYIPLYFSLYPRIRCIYVGLNTCACTYTDIQLENCRISNGLARMTQIGRGHLAVKV